MTIEEFETEVLSRFDLALNVVTITAVLLLFVAGVLLVRGMWS